MAFARLNQSGGEPGEWHSPLRVGRSRSVPLIGNPALDTKQTTLSLPGARKCIEQVLAENRPMSGSAGNQLETHSRAGERAGIFGGRFLTLKWNQIVAARAAKLTPSA